MFAYRPQTTKTGGLPNISYIQRKPEDLGLECKSGACPVLKILTYLEIQRGKEGMLVKPYHRALGATAACTVRLGEGVSQSHLDGCVETGKGDSWFGSVKAVVGVAGRGVPCKAVLQVKMNKTGFPKSEIQEVLQDAPGGTSIVLKATEPKSKCKLIAIGYKYNSKKVLHFIASEGAGSTTPGKPYLMRYPDEYGNVTYCEVPRPEIISKFFKQSNCVDVHNQLRQYALRLEKKWVTCNCFFRCHTTLVGMNVVDTFHLANFHSILSENSVTGFRRMHSLNEDILQEAEDNSNASEMNKYTMKAFAGVLAHQLIKFSEIKSDAQVFRANRSSILTRPASCARNLNNVYCTRSTTIEDPVDAVMSDVGEDEETLQVTFSTKNATMEDADKGDVIEILEEVYDINGNVHQAVRIGDSVDGVGNICKQTVRMCSRRLSRKGGSCPVTKTRVKCFQCNVPLCYPLRHVHQKDKAKYCFIQHINSISKNAAPPSSRFIRMETRSSLV